MSESRSSLDSSSGDNLENSTTVSDSGISDQPVDQKEDTLGFEPYVEAVASFLLNEKTKPPLTLSVEGEWGSGKSSFMLQLDGAIKENHKQTIWFNAWRHDKVESMWAAFALQFIEQLSKALPLHRRALAFIKLNLVRFDYKRGWFSLLSLFVLVILYFVVFRTIIKEVQNQDLPWLASLINNKGEFNFALLLKLTGGAGFILLGAFLFKKISAIIGNPLAIDLRRYINTPNYENHNAFIEDFHKDFTRVINVLSKNNDRIFIFIDDLDRAEIPKAADLMQGLNMMISNSTRLIFIIGMDREKVAAGIAAKYKELLPFLATGVPELGDLPQATNFGYSFLEKFIQISFKIPIPGLNNVREFLEAVSGEDTPLSSEKNRPKVVIDDGPDSIIIKETTILVAQIFDYNPRRLKQFINAFRLKAHIAHSTGLFHGDNNYDPLTIPRLGKFVAITQRWPQITDDLIENPSLFDAVITTPDMPLVSTTPTEKLTVAQRWKSIPQFMAIVKAGTSEFKFDIDEYSLFKLNVLALLQTSPRLVTSDHSKRSDTIFNEMQ